MFNFTCTFVTQNILKGKIIIDENGAINCAVFIQQ